MKHAPAVEIKGTTLPVLRVVVRDAGLAATLAERAAALADTLARARPLLAESLVVLDLRDCTSPPDDALVAAVRDAGVRFAGAVVPEGGDAQTYAALALPLIEAPEPEPPRSRERAPEARAASPAPPPEAARDAPVAPLVLARPLRSGQRVYARGRDLVVLAPTSSGAELIADGSIYAFAPLRGRALAGASGAPDARIVATDLDAELVAIAGVYRTLESADTAPFAGRVVSVALERGADGEDRLVLAAVEGAAAPIL